MPKLKTRLAIAIGALLGLLALPASGQAAVNFGSQLDHEPTEMKCEMTAPCSVVSLIHPIPPEGDRYSGGAPIDGVITKFRARAWAYEKPGQITFRVADISLPDPGNDESAVASAKGTGPTVTIQPDEAALETPITEVAGRLPVKKGQHLAVDITASIGIIYNSNGDKFSYLFVPPLVEGSAPRGSTEAINHLLVAATIEPDADNDGFGDETQDQCPRQATTQGPCDDSVPVVSGVSVKNGKATYSLNEAATVTLSLEKKLPGRRLGNKCVKQTPKNKTKKKCPRYKPHGKEIAGTGAAGANTVALPKLGPGSYRLTIVARDVAGNQSVTQTTFKVPKKGKRKAKGKK